MEQTVFIYLPFRYGLLIAATNLAQNREFKSATLRSHKMGAQEQDIVFWFTLNERSLTKSELKFKKETRGMALLGQ